MKHVQKKLAIISLFAIFMSSEVHALGSKRPTTPSTPSTPTKPTTPSTPPVVIIPTPGSTYIETIKDFASQSSCATYSWKSRGRAPAGYIRGMALTYARSVCRLQASKLTPSGISSLLSAARGDAAKDALAHYQTNFKDLISLTKAGTEPLRAVYVLGTGLGMRESSGKYCEGRDMSATNTSADTAEAGVFQTSYNSMTASPEFSKLYAEYKADTSKCYLDVFKVGATCSSSNASIAGSGAGAAYQAFNKSCPAFAAEYAMMMLRVRRNHYGPINRKEAEVVPACDKMLESVQEFVMNDPNACDDLL